MSLCLCVAVAYFTVSAVLAQEVQIFDDFEKGLHWQSTGGSTVQLTDDPVHSGQHALAFAATVQSGGEPRRMERSLPEPVNWTRYQYFAFEVYVDSPRESLPDRVATVEVRGYWNGVARQELTGLKPRTWTTVQVSLMEMWDRDSIQRWAVELHESDWRPGEMVRLVFDDLRATTGEPYDSLRRAAQPPPPTRVASFGSCVIYAEDALTKVFADEPYPPEDMREGGCLEIAAAGNEYEPAQLVFRSETDVTDLRVTATDLRCGGEAIAAEHVRCQRVGYVTIDAPTDAGGRAGMCPDLLYDDDRFTLTAGRNQSVWVTVYVPKDTPAGVYEGALHVEQVGSITPSQRKATPSQRKAEVPLRVRVFGFTLPDRVHCRTVFSLDRPQCEAYYGRWTFDLARAYYRNLAEHRASPMGFWFVPDPHDLDCTEYDRHLAVFKELGFNSYCLVEPWLSPHVKPWEPKDLPALRLETGATPDDLIVYHRGYLAAEQGQRWRWTDGWHHAAFTWDGRTLSLLLDGEVVATAAESQPFAPYAGGRWHIGARSGQANQMFRGWLDDFRLSGVARTPEAIRAALGTPLAADEHTLVLLNFEAAGGLSVPDASGHGHHASANQTIRFQDGPFGRCAHLERSEVISLPGVPSLDPAQWEQVTVEVRFRRDGDPIAWTNLWSYWPDVPGRWEQNQRFLRAMIDHAQEQGILENTFLYVIDEPDFNGKMETMARYGRELAELDPRVAEHKMRLVTCRPDPQYAGRVDIWCPVLQQWFPDPARERQEAGDHVWWYVCCGPGFPYPNFFTDHRALEPRILFWMQYRFGVEGFLYWSLNWWGWPNNDPFQKHLRVAGAIGDGMLLYPGPTGPLNSIRWECIRDGIEDYEYHWLLADAIRRARQEGAEEARIGAMEEVLREADAFLVTHRDVSFLNAGHLRQARLCLAEALEQIRSSPF